MSIQNRAMLVDLNVSCWSARRHDKKISDEVAENHNADKSAGRYNKLLVAKETLSDLVRISGLMRTYHYSRTLPWGDTGRRILASSLYMEYMDKVRELKSEFEIAREKFIREYPRYKADARQRLNGLYSEADYPRQSALEEMFHVDVTIYPLENASDFRVELSKEETERIRRDIEANFNNTLAAAHKAAYTRVADALQHVIERMTAYATDSETGKLTGSRFSDTVITNLQDLIGILPGLNITDDAKLTAIGKRIADKVAAYSPATLRESATGRVAVVKDAEKILRDVNAVMAKMQDAYAK